MTMRQAAGAAAGIAVEENVAFQDVEYDKLKMILLKNGQILNPDFPEMIEDK
jgi:hypothetical protein